MTQDNPGGTQEGMPEEPEFHVHVGNANSHLRQLCVMKEDYDRLRALCEAALKERDEAKRLAEWRARDPQRERHGCGWTTMTDDPDSEAITHCQSWQAKAEAALTRLGEVERETIERCAKVCIDYANRKGGAAKKLDKKERFESADDAAARARGALECANAIKALSAGPAQKERAGDGN